MLAGGRSERLGGIDKATVEFAGSTLLDRVVEAVRDADDIVVVGPERPTSRAVTWCQEKPIGGGPVAAFRTGVAASSADAMVLLATDLPFIAGAIPYLLEALTPTTDVAVLRDESGRANYLATAWRRSSVEARFAELGDPTGLPMRKLLEGLAVAEVADLGGWGFDCDTPEALEIARQRESEFPMTDENTLDGWLHELCDALGLPRDLAEHRNLLLEVARDAAHGVARPAAPLTTFLVGYAAGREGSEDAVQRAADIATEHALQRGN